MAAGRVTHSNEARASRNKTLPNTVEQAINLADKAKTEVETEINQYKPRKPVEVIDGGTSNSNMPEPKNTQDVIRRTLNQ